jgi:hypothetical protein
MPASLKELFQKDSRLGNKKGGWSTPRHWVRRCGSQMHCPVSSEGNPSFQGQNETEGERAGGARKRGLVLGVFCRNFQSRFPGKEAQGRYEYLHPYWSTAGRSNYDYIHTATSHIFRIHVCTVHARICACLA